MFEPWSAFQSPRARVLLSIDYESWFALSRRFDSIASAPERRALDDGFCREAMDGILFQLGSSKASFFMVGEVIDWYPEIAEKIVLGGHELGFHCHTHRPLGLTAELKKDLEASRGWREKYAVRGYRAPMVRIAEDAYGLLAENGFTYSSSIYAPAGKIYKNGGILEIPVSTQKLFGAEQGVHAPRHMSLGLLAGGEFPFGSSLFSGLCGGGVLRVIEKMIDRGHSPVLFLHPYELVRPENWPGRLRKDLMRNPALLPFTVDKSGFLKQILEHFPVSSLGTWLDEAAGVVKYGG